MPDMLNVSVSGLRAFQRALETTSHNIANVATPGYSRQGVQLATSQPQVFGSSSLGTGVYVNGIRRFSDELLSTQMRTASSGYSRLDVYAEKAGALSNLFANGATGLSAALQKLSDAFQDVANTPTSTAARQVLLSEAQGLVTRFSTYESRLNDLEAQVNEQLRGEASEINAIAANIARLNQQIASASSTTSSSPNDLLDERDRQLADLASRIDTTVIRQDGHTVNVFVGNGQPLVLGTTSAQLVAQADPFQPARVTLAFRTSSGTVDISSSLGGGSVGGLLDFRREMLDPARNELGRIAAGLVDAVNTQHALGTDLNGQPGGAFFAIGRVEALAASTNNGTAMPSATRTDPSQLTSHDYLLRFDGSAWSVQRADTGAAVAFTVSGGALEFDGLSVDTGTGAVAGDRFLVRPTAAAISGMQVVVGSPARIAAATPVLASASSANTGTGSISPGEVTDAADPALRETISIRFTAPGAWEARDSANALVGSGSFAPGDSIELNGWRVSIDGAPAAGDSFTVAASNGTGDNRNALTMADVLSRGFFANGTESLNDAVGRFVGSVGVATAGAQASRDAQKVIYDDSVASVDTLSGVNLDEEAANLIRYQQAYQAAAQMIRVTQELMDTLLNAVRR